MKKNNFLTDEELKKLLKSYYENEETLMKKEFSPRNIENYIRKVYEKAESMQVMKPVNMSLKLTYFERIKAFFLA